MPVFFLIFSKWHLQSSLDEILLFVRLILAHFYHTVLSWVTVNSYQMKKKTIHYSISVREFLYKLTIILLHNRIKSQNRLVDLRPALHKCFNSIFFETEYTRHMCNLHKSPVEL